MLVTKNHLAKFLSTRVSIPFWNACLGVFLNKFFFCGFDCDENYLRKDHIMALESIFTLKIYV